MTTDDHKRWHSGPFFLAPRDLSVAAEPLRRAIVLGSCMAEVWTGHRPEGVDVADFMMISRTSVIPDPPRPASDYDFALIQAPLRDVIGDHFFWPLAYDDLAGYERVFAAACASIDQYLENALEWTSRLGIPAFVGNFMLPQADLTGRLMPRYDLRNALYFVECVNRHLEAGVRRHNSAYLLDIDRISASIGRRHVQDDAVSWLAHGSVLSYTFAEHEERIEPLAPITDHYDPAWHPVFVESIWAEAEAMHRTIRQTDAVKLVVVDLDDTLWRGVSGDNADVGPEMVEGWPLGMLEALMYLKKRGVLLAIISKNDEARVRAAWPIIVGGRMSLDDFAVVRINWRPKPENMAEILAAVNLLPRSTVFIDDNLVERAEMLHAYPDLRVLGRYLLYLRRILLWSSETQVEAISDESGRRTTMIQGQVAREASRTNLDREDFLASLDLRVALAPLEPGSARIKRAFELLNKTNQFNTTGERWTIEAFTEFLASGGRATVFEVWDRFTSYGLVGLCLSRGTAILQFVMSCRVNGLDVERAALSEILADLRRAADAPIVARFVETSANLLCRDLWARCGFERQGDDWVMEGRPTLRWPNHIARVKDESESLQRG